MDAGIFARFPVLSGKTALRFSSFVPPFRLRLPGARQDRLLTANKFLKSWRGASAGGAYNHDTGMFRVHDHGVSCGGGRKAATLSPALGKGRSDRKMPDVYPMRSTSNLSMSVVAAHARTGHRDTVLLQPYRRSVCLPVFQEKIAHFGGLQAGSALLTVRKGGSRSIGPSGRNEVRRGLDNLLAGKSANMLTTTKKARMSQVLVVPGHDASSDRRAIGKGSVGLEGSDYPCAGQHRTGRFDPVAEKVLHPRPGHLLQTKNNIKLFFPGVPMSRGFVAVPPHISPASKGAEMDAGTPETQGRPRNSISGDVEGYFSSDSPLFASIGRSCHVSMRAQGAMVDEIALPQYPNLSVGFM